MRRALPFCLLVCLQAGAQVAPIPVATELPGSPFFIRKTWFIGGAGNWDYLTLDPPAHRLYIAHGSTVQVVDLDSGSVVGQITGFREAYAIALDGTGEFGFVSDGPAGDVKVFDRQTLAVDATIPIFCSPRSIAFEPQSKLLFAICGANAANPATPPTPIHRRAAGGSQSLRKGNTPEQTNFSGVSHIVAIDTERSSVAMDIEIAGDFRFAQPDGDGQVYVTVAATEQPRTVNGYTSYEVFPQRIAKLDGLAIAERAQRHRGAQSQENPASEPLSIDWSDNAFPDSLVHFLGLPSGCKSPQGLAVDGKDQRLFVACEDQRFMVLNASTGGGIASLTTGPGDDVIGYDQGRGLIFVANGAGYGSLTIIHQDQTTDSYSVIQNLPTRERARTLAVDPETGEVYLVTDFNGVDLTKMGGIGTLKAAPVPGSFQVLVVGQ